MENGQTIDYLASLRFDHRSVEELPAELMPVDMAAAYKIQSGLVDVLCKHWKGQRAGYKVALTNEAAQRMLGVPHPVFGTMISSRVHTSGVVLDAKNYSTRLIECEFGFKIERDVPVSQSPYTVESISSYVAKVYPAIELVEHHFAGIDRVTAESLAADNAIHGAWIRGEAVDNWQTFDLAEQTTRLLVNGNEKLAGSGSRVLGHPMAGLVWLANNLPRYGLSLKQGEYVTTGVTTDEIYPAVAGDSLIADFPNFGQVELSFN